MYSNQKIPFPFGQTSHGDMATPQPSSAIPEKIPEKEDITASARENPIQRKTLSHNSTPLLVFLLHDLFSK